MIESLLGLFTVEYFFGAIRMATPIALAGIGEVYLERSGIINLGMEGIMLVGAFFAVLGAAASGSAVLGLLTAIVAATVLGLVFGFAVITLRANQIVAGAAINIGALGLTSFLSRVVFGIRALPIQVAGIGPWPVPVLSKIPFIGRVFFQHSPVVYFTYALILFATFVLYRTTWGLKIRSVGEHPRAADTVGINVYAWRYATTLLNGLLCGIAGASLSLAHLNTFVDNMTAGRGFIALAAVIFGRWNPFGAALAALLFGAADALQLRFQAFGVGISNQLLLMMPYLLTLIAVIFFRGQAVTPAALAQPYEKEGS
jgi:ABC-type uncharacterized transport system permease subunit